MRETMESRYGEGDLTKGDELQNNVEKRWEEVEGSEGRDSNKSIENNKSGKYCHGLSVLVVKVVTGRDCDL